jgi:hypothetical protein
MRFAIRERCEWESCVSQEVRLEISTIKITIIGRDSFFHFFFRVEGLFVLNRLKNDNRGCFLWVSSGEGDDILRDEIGVKRRR